MSIENEPINVVQAVTRTSQIIVGSLAMGVIWFMAIVLFLLSTPDGPPGEGPAAARAPIITYMAAAVGAAALVASYFVPNLIVDSGLRGILKSGPSAPTRADESGAKQVKSGIAAHQLLPLYQTQLIVGAALVEGGAFFATIAYMLEHQYLALGAAGVLLAALLARFPTLDRVNGWLEDKLGRLRELHGEDF
jgi:hypothetical protein